MIVLIDKSFERDVKKLRDPKVLSKISECIKELQKAENLSGIKNLKKLIGGEVYYRIRILDYRLGFTYEAEKIILIRFLHRKEIYNYFP